jgi:hypothetical protein
MSTKPNLKREKTLKVPLNDVEQDQLRKFCGTRVAPFVRDLVFAHIRAAANHTGGKRHSERPRHGHQHGHAQRFPGRAAVAGGFRRLHL